MRTMTLLALATLLGNLNHSAWALDHAWTIQKVDRGAPGNRMTDLKEDSNGNIHLIYTGCSDKSCQQSELFYATLDSRGKWQKTSVDHDGDDTGWFPSLTVDPIGGLHVVYANHDKQKLRYATRDMSGQWNTQDLGKGRGGWWTSSAWSGDTLYMAHTRLPSDGWEPAALEVGMMKNGKWEFETVDQDRNAGWFTSMAIGREGMPVVSYTTVLGQPLGFMKLAMKTANGWDIKEIDGDSIKSHVTTDQQGFIHLIYQCLSPENSKFHNLMYVSNFPDGKWKKTVLKNGAELKKDTGDFPRIAVDPKGGLHVAYNEGKELHYARNSGAGWETQVVDDFGASAYPWIMADSKGRVHISYENGTGIHYAVCADCAVH